VYPFSELLREEVVGIEYGERSTILKSDVVDGFILGIPGWKVGDVVRIEYATSSATALGTWWVPLPAYYVNGKPGPIFLGKEKPDEGKNIIYARISEGPEWIEYTQDYRFKILDSRINIEVPGEPQIYDFATDGNKDISNCDILKRGTAYKDGNKYFADARGSICDYIVMGELDTRLSYLMRIQGEDIEGRSTKFFLYNTGSKRNDIEYLLDKDKFDQTFSILPWSWDGFYTLNIDVRSFGQKTENILHPVEVRWFPIEQISGAKIITNPKFPAHSAYSTAVAGGSNSQIENGLKIKAVRKTGTWLYRVKVEGSGLLRLSQGYDEGWIAPPIKHVKVDGWANGWMIEGSGEVTIFYWPQLLEYLGFVILGVTIWILVIKRE
jgi:hypothetical protein